MAKNKGLLDSLTPVQRAVVAVLVVLVGGAVALWKARQQPAPPVPPGELQTLANRNVRFGFPAPAKADPASRDAYLIDRPQYVLSYNDSKKIPNWVCWNLTSGDVGKADRGAFEPDPDLPKEFTRIRSSDYSLSGFDRGHMCASKDRSATDPDNDVTFFMTNVVPQAPNCNQKGWKDLEEHCRRLAGQGNELYIACGPHGRGGQGKSGPADHIGKGKYQVEVPESVWKVVLVLPKGGTAPTPQSHTIAVWMPNTQSVGPEWKPYAVSVAEVERRTGYTFFPLVPEAVAGPLKQAGP
jgi:endonuclease G, mitochondrial